METLNLESRAALMVRRVSRAARIYIILTDTPRHQANELINHHARHTIGDRLFRALEVLLYKAVF